MRKINLEEDQALVIQMVSEIGEEDFEDLVATLRFDRPSLANILRNLQHKGLITLKNSGYGTYVSLSAKGKKTVQLLWPETPYIHYS